MDGRGFPSGLRIAALVAAMHLGATAAFGEDAGPGASLAAGPAAASATDIAARYAVTVERPGRPVVRQVWYFTRSDSRIAIVKGDVEEIWRRDPQGRIDLQRVFHAERRIVGYSPGELATLEVDPQWQRLGGLVDLRGLKPSAAARRATGSQQPIQRWSGNPDGNAVAVDWLPGIGLPERVAVRHADGSRTVIVLSKQAAVAPTGWPGSEQGAQDYLRLDAADFGDMPYEPAVRKATALDIRLGWRIAHDHD